MNGGTCYEKSNMTLYDGAMSQSLPEGIIFDSILVENSCTRMPEATSATVQLDIKVRFSFGWFLDNPKYCDDLTQPLLNLI